MSRTVGVKVHMQLLYLCFGLNVATRHYSNTNNLAKSIQSKKVSTASSRRLTDLTMQVLESLRNKECFNNFYLNVLDKAKFNHFVIEPVCKWKSLDYSILQYVEGYDQSLDYHPNAPKTYYRQI